jgi:dinuclear metal center YbgI/SA1388 family protein
MSTTLEQIEIFLQQTFDGQESSDVSWNGTQIENDGKIDHIYAGVDATFDFFKAAPNPEHALFLVHHGIYWKFLDPSMRGVLREKIGYCMNYNSALIAYHLPLDIHPEYGNNSQILKKLGFIDDCLKPFGFKEGVFYGYSNCRKHEINLEEILSISKKIFSKETILFAFGNKEIKSCAVVSGSGGFAIQEASEKKIDLFVTGEYSHSAYTFSRDHGVNLLCLTHYGSEKDGVIALGEEIAKKFRIIFTFLDIPPIF